MEHAIRTFKLRVSPEGFEVLANCHHRLMIATRTLIPYGATLTAAMELLDRERWEAPIAAKRAAISALSGSLTLFVGAPRWVSSKATEFTGLLGKSPGWENKVSIGEVYLLALYGFSRLPDSELGALAESLPGQ